VYRQGVRGGKLLATRRLWQCAGMLDCQVTPEIGRGDLGFHQIQIMGK
jgi:hypothetical protein